MKRYFIYLLFLLIASTFTSAQRKISLPLGSSTNINDSTVTGAKLSTAVNRNLSETIVDAYAWGVRDDSTVDNANALMAMRAALAGKDVHYTILMPHRSHGEIRYSNNRWLFGIKNFTLDLNGSTIRTIYSGSDEAFQRCLYVGTLLENNTLTYTGSRTFTQADKIKTVSAGSNSVTLKLAAAGPQYAYGNRILIYGYDQVGYGYPPGVKYFEWNEVKSVSGGVITLKYPLTFSYDTTWVDVSGTAGGGSGKPRIINLDRSQNVYCKYAEIKNGRFGNSTGGGSGSLCFAADQLIVSDVTVDGLLWPSENREVTYKNVQHLGIVEYDKLAGKVTAINTDFFQSPNAGGGVHEIVIQNCRIAESTRFNPKYLTLSNSSIRGNLDPDNYAPAIGDYPAHSTIRRVTLENLTFSATASYANPSFIDFGAWNTKTIDTVISNKIYIPFSNFSSEPFISMEPGVTKFFKTDGSKGGLVTGFTFDSAYNSGQGAFVISGEWNNPVKGESWTWNYINEVIDKGGHKVVNGSQKLWGPNAIRWAGNTSTTAIKESHYTQDYFLYESGNRELVVPYNARIISIEVNVIKAYSGSDGTAKIEIYSYDNGYEPMLSANLKTIGRRYVDQFQSFPSTPISGDDYNSSYISPFRKVLRFQTTGSSGAISNFTSATKPQFEVVVRWMPF